LSSPPFPSAILRLLPARVFVPIRRVALLRRLHEALHVLLVHDVDRKRDLLRHGLAAQAADRARSTVPAAPYGDGNKPSKAIKPQPNVDPSKHIPGDDPAFEIRDRPIY
jgi:hypothetical protein